MKKTLVAFAVLAASGASFAQVTITGAVAFGYTATTNASGDALSGMGIDDSSITIKAADDMGGGFKSNVSMVIASMNRSGITGGDLAYSLTTPVGVLTYSLAEGSDFMSRGVGGVGGVDMAGKVFSGLGGGSTDALSFDMPLTSTISLGLDSVEGDQAEGTGAAGSQLLLASTAYQRGSQVRLGYAEGKFKATLRYAAFDSFATSGNNTNRVRLAGQYDFGFVKVGAASSILSYYPTGVRSDSLVSASIPVTPAVTFGLNWANRNWNSVPTSTAPLSTAKPDGNSSGYGLVVGYSMSKNTSLTAQYSMYNPKVTDINKSTTLNVALATAF